MVPIQPGPPLSSLLLRSWPIIIIGLKDCFFIIPLHEQDRERFAFSVSTLNNSHTVKRYHWKVLPRGILNSPTLCHYIVQQLLESICKQFP